MSAFLAAAATLAEALAGLEGCWSGNLAYRDYRSDGMAEIPMRSCVEAADDGSYIADNSAYTDPGFLVYIHGVTQVVEDGAVVREAMFRDGGMDVREKTVDSFEETEDGFTLVLLHEGDDADAAADIKETLSVSGAVLIREKAVRPVGSDAAYDFRNRVSLTREDETQQSSTASGPADD